MGLTDLYFLCGKRQANQAWGGRLLLVASHPRQRHPAITGIPPVTGLATILAPTGADYGLVISRSEADSCSVPADDHGLFKAAPAARHWTDS
jgi:hypothetical protein